MQNSRSAWFRAIIFIVIFIMINYGLIFLLVPSGGYSRMTMREMYTQTKNIDVVFAGASLTQRGVNPYIMDKELGCNTFDYAFTKQIYSGTYYSLKELFEYHKPKLVVLTADPFSYTAQIEDPMVYVLVSLYTKSILNRIEYYFGTAKDGYCLDKLFVWSGYHIKSLHDLSGNIYKKTEHWYVTYPEDGQVEELAKNKNDYVGKGFVKFDSDLPQNVINYDKIGKASFETRNVNDIQKTNVEYLKKISELCKANNSELIVINTPFPAYEVLGTKNYFEFDKEIEEVTRKLGIEYYNYNLIKPELFKPQGDYFMDHEHLNSKGADAFSKSLAAFLKLRQKGENMSKYFYTPKEYCESIDYITNTWFSLSKNDGKIALAADSLHGSKVIPEYQFVLTDSDTGESQILRDYDKNPKFIFDPAAHKRYKIRVNARVAGSNNDEFTRYYEEDIAK